MSIKPATTYPIIAMQMRLDLVADAKRPITGRSMITPGNGRTYGHLQCR